MSLFAFKVFNSCSNITFCTLYEITSMFSEKPNKLVWSLDYYWCFYDYLALCYMTFPLPQQIESHIKCIPMIYAIQLPLKFS